MADGLPEILDEASSRLEGLAEGRIPPPMHEGGPAGSASRFAAALNRFIEYHAGLSGYLGPLSCGELRGEPPPVCAALELPLKKLHQQLDTLQHLNRLKDEFVGMAAHDLRSPLGVIELYVTFILENPRGQLSETEREFLGIVRRQVGFMLKLVNDLLDVTRIESGRLDLKRVPGDWLGFVRRNVELNGALAGRRGVTIVLEDGGEERIEIGFDANRMEQVLNNLIGNAIKFSPERGRITVRVRRDGQWVRTSVADDGTGIPPGELATLFQPFHRGTAPQGAEERSTGLGLPISRRIVEAHGGTIDGESRVGGGATFTFTLPAAG